MANTLFPKYRRNLYCLYTIKLSKWLMLIMPIVALFYNENGLSELNIYILQAIYSISVAVMEIPSGYMADIVGRKKTLVFGALLGTLGFVIYSFSTSFSGFLVGEVILGLGGSFISGADSALLYESLAAMRMKHRYLKFEGRVMAIGGFAETAAAICGGALAALFSYRTVYFSQTVIAALAIPAALLLLEAPRKKIAERPSLGHITRVCRESLLKNYKLAGTIFLSSITGIATLCMAWTAQIYFLTVGFTEVEITPLWVALNLTVAIFSAYAYSVHHFLGKRLLFFFSTIYIPTTYIFLGLFPLSAGLLSLLFFYAVRGYVTPVLKNYINNHCDSSVRATVLSLRNLIIRLGFALLGPTIGWITGRFSLSYGLLFSGILLFLLSLSAFFFTRRHSAYDS
jgi:MFS family permease